MSSENLQTIEARLDQCTSETVTTNDMEEKEEADLVSSGLGNIPDIDEQLHTEKEQSLVHTAIIEKDNPFFEQNQRREESMSKSTPVKISNVKKPVNPNNTYNSEADDLLHNRKSADSTLPSLSANSNSKENSVTSLHQIPSSNLNDSTMNEGSKRVQIKETNKVSEGQGRNYIAYTIQFGDNTVKRRYSDFELLRNILLKLFPMTLIPPIPEKQSIKNYGKAITGSNSSTYLLPSEDVGPVDLSLSVINGSVSNRNEKLIRHRIRMLTQFLNKLLQNKEIGKTSIINDFLDPNNPHWSDFINSSATFSSLPKNRLQCNPLNPTSTTRIHASLPIPSSSILLSSKENIDANKRQNEENFNSASTTKDSFQAIEQDYKKYEFLLDNGVYKYNRRITRNFHDLKYDMKDLNDALAQFVNKKGQETDLVEQLSYLSNTYDESAILLEKMVSRLYYNINEPLDELTRMAGSARELLKFRKLKYIQNENIKKTLSSKTTQLSKIEQQNHDFKKIDRVIDQEMSKSHKISLERPPEDYKSSTYSGKLFNKFNKLAAMVKETVNYQDIDPRVTSENLQKDIKVLTDTLNVTEADLVTISDVIANDQLPNFSEEREREIIDILKHYSKYMKDYDKKKSGNLERA
ncbi:hypothetical protein KAFR_0A06830 [Kazachstania africana CBS 2517]|uniref:Autophagy-related protein 20 n=1 Tax=Kazachstania africana (strain ATCC 22294 / BCRC 22015 / CBS 2517 / CECT 1963 / NBRC 1671 / NRRL Y-8276) TaxID=1071382 RepID=H2AP18_KAZAF|nr:hypothetical protein KAFR_0A06830 [Kazachstania africana CBS 2517]CCF56118.1 hypothetical protein KAFR_0A06830 [Kazachstania africana CBS 2517]